MMSIGCIEDDAMVPAVASRVFLSLDAVASVLCHQPTSLALRSAQDLLVLCCALTLEDVSCLQERCIPQALEVKLDNALGFSARADLGLWSRLSQAKYKVFTLGVRWDCKRPKGRRVRRGKEQSEPS